MDNWNFFDDVDPPDSPDGMNCQPVSPDNFLDLPDSPKTPKRFFADDEQKSVTGFVVPQFDFSHWSPDPPAGLHYLCLLPLNEGYQIQDQRDQCRCRKIKTPRQYRQARPSRSYVEGQLRLAAGRNDIQNATEAIDGGANPSCIDFKSRTPLHMAAAHGHRDMVKLLLDHGANPNLKDVLGNTPLHLAACTHNVPVVTLLLKSGTDVKAVDGYGRTPLSLAKSRLTLLQRNSKYTSSQLKFEVCEVTVMLKEYLQVSGMQKHSQELDDLCDRLQRTSTREEVDMVNNLLSNFTNLTLQKDGPPKT